MRRIVTGLLALGLSTACAAPATPPPSAAAPATVVASPVESWLHEAAISLDAPASYVRVAETFDGADVVGLGEATHGTHEFFAIKAAVFRALVETGRFQTLAMELEPEAAGRIDAVLQGADGDLRALSRGSYFFLEADAIVELLEWMKAYNAQAEHRVRVVGIDLDASQKELVQTQCGDRAGCRTVLRDMAMAENVQALGTGVVLWAHNGHVAHFASDDGWRPLGQLLRDALADRYRAVAFEFAHGGFVAPAGGALPVRRTFESSTGRAMAEYELGPPPPEALGHALDHGPAETWFVPLTNLPEPVTALFEDNRNLHNYGAMPPPAERRYEIYPPLPQLFDALIFVRETRGYGVSPAAPGETSDGVSPR